MPMDRRRWRFYRVALWPFVHDRRELAEATSVCAMMNVRATG